jgi:hypothetical protein
MMTIAGSAGSRGGSALIRVLTRSLLLICFAIVPAVQAGTVVSVTGSDDAAPILGDPFGADEANAFSVSWTLTQAYTNVSITAQLDGWSGTAYLTTQLGPGTTIGDQLASTSFDVGDVLFSGLTLSPGTYFLVITTTPLTSLSWEASRSPVVSVGSGAAIGDDSYAFGVQNLGYVPAATFGPGFGNTLLYAVAGDASAVPEPGTFTLGLIALSGVALLRKRNNTRI